jgi:methyl-accepting chemotaxis protein
MLFFKRRQLLVSPSFQLTYIGYTAVVALFSTAIFYSAYRLLILDLVKEFSADAAPQVNGALTQITNEPSLLPLIQRKVSSMDLFFFLASIIDMVFLCIGGLWISNRVVGPMVRLKNHMEKVARGETVGEIHFRDGDFFPEIADAYNDALKKTGVLPQSAPKVQS